MTGQLSLGLRLRDEATFANFLAPDDTIRARAKAALGGTGEPLVYLWGSKGSGRSHLLQAACHRVREEGGGAQYFSLGDMIDYPPDQVLDDMEYQDLVCLAGVEAVAGRPGWEEALFGFYNRIQDQGNRLVIGADGPPRELPLALPDLKSRLSAALVFHLATYDDEDKIAILRHRAARLGIELSREVGLFIVNRGSRDLDHLMAYLERLDLASLAEKRRVTIPFVKQVFGW